MTPLLLADDDPPYQLRAGSDPRILLVCDHASAAIPRRLGTLGLAAADRDAHVASDIGARAVATRLAQRLDATLLAAGYSRLVIDCNRYPWDPASILADSHGTPVAGNAGLSPAERAQRIAELFLPYHRAIGAELDRRLAAGVRPLVMSIHSCTDELAGVRRPWQIGVSYTAPGGLAQPLLAALSHDGTVCVGDNQPYALDPSIDYTVPEHALRRGLAYLQLEFRQDLVAAPSGAVAWADRLLAALLRVWPSAPPEESSWSPPWPSPHAEPGAVADPVTLLTRPTT